MLDQINDEIDQFTADGAYDGYPTYYAIFRHTMDARVVIPPRANAVGRPNAQKSCQRDVHIETTQADGRLKWQTCIGRGKLIETAMGRCTGVIGPRMRARSFLAQQTEAAIGVESSARDKQRIANAYRDARSLMAALDLDGGSARPGNLACLEYFNSYKNDDE